MADGEKTVYKRRYNSSNYPLAIREHLQYLTLDYWCGDREFESFSTPGKNYIKRLNQGELLRKGTDYYRLRKHLEEKAEWSALLRDNILRFTGLATLQRLFVVRQTSLFSTNLAYTSNNNLLASFAGIQKQGAYRGYFRGSLLSYLQFIGCQLQAYVISDGDFGKYVSTLFFLETIFHPLDTVRVRYQADLNGKYTGLLDCLNKTKPGELLAGLPYKLVFAGIYSFYLTQSYNYNGWEKLKNLPYLIAAYPFLALKSIGQVTQTSANPVTNLVGSLGVAGKFLKPDGLKVLYRGFTPFAVLSLVAPQYLPKLWSEEGRENALENVDPGTDEWEVKSYGRIELL